MGKAEQHPNAPAVPYPIRERVLILEQEAQLKCNFHLSLISFRWTSPLRHKHTQLLMSINAAHKRVIWPTASAPAASAAQTCYAGKAILQCVPRYTSNRPLKNAFKSQNAPKKKKEKKKRPARIRSAAQRRRYRKHIAQTEWGKIRCHNPISHFCISSHININT